MIFRCSLPSKLMGICYTKCFVTRKWYTIWDTASNSTELIIIVCGDYNHDQKGSFIYLLASGIEMEFTWAIASSKTEWVGRTFHSATSGRGCIRGATGSGNWARRGVEPGSRMASKASWSTIMNQCATTKDGNRFTIVITKPLEIEVIRKSGLW